MATVSSTVGKFSAVRKYMKDGKAYLCDGHMCRSMWWQDDYNGEVVCNGCLARPLALNVSTAYPVTKDNEPLVWVHAGTLARNLTDEEIAYGPDPEEA